MAGGPQLSPGVAGLEVVGLVDLIVAVGTGAWLNAIRPGAMADLAGLPLTLVPLWLAPVLMASHVVVFRWLRVRGAAHGPAALDPRLA